MSKNAHVYFQPSGHHGVPINGTQVMSKIKTMIRDFSLVFLLLISDRRNLHRDSRRDTEQNVPWVTNNHGGPIGYTIIHCLNLATRRVMHRR